MDRDPSTAHPARTNKMRPHSQGSNSSGSTQSAVTQQHVDHSSFADMSGVYAGQWHPHHPGHSQEMHPGQQGLGPEDLLVQSLPHMATSTNSFAMHSSMGAPMDQQHLQFQQMRAPGAGGVPNQPVHQNMDQVNWGDHDSHMMEDMTAAHHVDHNANRKATNAKGSKRKSSANNDGEMRELFQTNRDRPLEEVAQWLRGNERGPNAERKRQLYAMLWLNSACTESKNSIPRGRVYHVYASRCSDDRVVVLNPASFGKLVRVVFPDIKTRRLGVRGESKYHYCNFDLREQPPAEAEVASHEPTPAREIVNQTQGQDSLNATTASVDQSAAGRLPSPEDAPTAPRRPSPTTDGAPRSHSRYNFPHVTKDHDLNTTSAKTPLKLWLMTESEKAGDTSEPVALPPIGRFLPPQTDQDAAHSLMALYRSHCTSIIESLRYCREKSFFHLYTSFHGTLTMPVQKLFAHPSLAAWIEQCDIMLYQRLIRLVAQLSLQVLPKPIINSMRSISERLVRHIQESFQGQPAHVIEAKVGPAAVFSGILDRMLRVNITAHAAANSMANAANRNQMFEDWVKLVNPRKIAESVPTRGMDDVVTLLVNEMKYLVEPETVPEEYEGGNQGQFPTTGGFGSKGSESCLERWESFLMRLPSKFPYASHADIAWCVERVGTAIMRDLTISGSQSFSAWWVVKTFMDEEIWFLAEAGGFLHTTSLRKEAAETRTLTSKDDGSKEATTDLTGQDAMDASHTSAPAPTSPGPSDRAPFPPKHNQAPANVGNELHEDSGIGIRTPDTDFPMDKFDFSTVETPDMDIDTADAAQTAVA